MAAPSPPAAVKMPGTPPRWANAVVRGLLRVPGLNRILGKGFSVITVTGARTGARYTTPVQHLEVDGRYVVLSQRMRTWWRNLRTRPEVELLVQGRTIRGHGSIADDAEARGLLATCLELQPRVAKFYGINPDPDGSVDPAAVEALLARVVVIVIDPD
jgi:deazaflavin-dependent oxidoreductase (nitroreductase family)